MAASSQSINPYGLSPQDLADLREIAKHLPAGDPRVGKVSTLLNSTPTQFEQERAPWSPKTDPALNDLAEMAKGAAKNIYQVSAPGIATSIAAEKKPELRAQIPAALQPTSAPELPAQIALNALPMMVGADELPQTTVAPKATSAVSRLSPLAKDAALDLLKDELPVIGRLTRLSRLGSKIADTLKGQPELPPSLPTPAPPPIQPYPGAGPAEMWGRTIPAAPIASEATVPLSDLNSSSIPRTMTGEAVLNKALTGLDNKTLLKVARSRGIDVAKEAQLKPGTADPMIIRQIIDDFTPEELDNVRSTGLEVARNRGTHDYANPNSAKEAWHVKVLQTYFPDVKIPQAALNRTQTSRIIAASMEKIAQPEIHVEEMPLADLLKRSIEAIEKARAAH